MLSWEKKSRGKDKKQCPYYDFCLPWHALTISGFPSPSIEPMLWIKVGIFNTPPKDVGLFLPDISYSYPTSIELVRLK